MQLLYLTKRFPVLSETFVHEQMRYFRSRGHSVHVICQAPRMKHADLVDMDCVDEVHAIGQITKYFWKLYAALPGLRGGGLPHSALAMASLLARKNIVPDAIVAHFGPNAIAASHLSKALRGRAPIIGVFHGYDLSSEVRRLGFSNYVLHGDRIDLFVAISDFWSKKLHSFGIPSQKIRTIHVGVDVSTHALPRRDGSSKLVVVSVGRLTEKKGFSTLIDAFSSLPSGLAQEAELVIIGDGPLRDRLLRQATGSPARDSIRVLGAMPHKDVLRRIERASVFVLASQTASDGDMEGIPVVLMEAMARGIPVISTYHSGIPELIEHGVSGLLVPEADAPALTDALASVVRDPAAAELRAQAGKRMIELRFNAQTQNAALEAAIMSLVAESRGDATAAARN